MIYRSSISTLFRNINTNLSRLTWDMAQLSNQISTGKRVNKPSDDPSGGALILSMRTVLADVDQYNKNVALSDDWLKQSEAVLQNMKNIVEQANVQAEQMATDTYCEENMDVAGENIRGLIESLIKVGNTRIGDRYIFSGMKTEIIPFNMDLTIHDPLADQGNSLDFTGQVLSPPLELREYTPLDNIPPQTKNFMVEVTTGGGIGGNSLAYLTIDPPGNHNAALFKAVATGTAGNAVQIRYVDPGAASQPLAVAVAGNQITVSLETDGAGNIISTAQEVIDAVNTDAASSALVTAYSAPGNSANGLVADTGGFLALSGGLDGAAQFRVSEDGGQTWGPDDAFSAATVATNIWNTTLGHATLTTNLIGSNNDLQFTAGASGTAGEDIEIEYVNPGPGYGPPTDVTVNGDTITVNLETDALGNIVATAQEVMTAINSNPAASTLLTASLADARAGGGGVVTAMNLTSLSGGDDDIIPADQGVQIFFTNDGSPLQVGDRFEIEVSYYMGDEQDIYVNTNRGTQTKVNTTGEETLGAAGDTDNIIDTLVRLTFALEQHDVDKVSGELPRLDDALDKLTAQMARIGVRLTRNQFTYNVLEKTGVSSMDRMSYVEDADITEVVAGLQMKQLAYEATLASTAFVTKLSLIDYIS